MLIEAMRKMTLSTWRRAAKNVLIKKLWQLSKLSKRTVVRLQAVIGRLTGLARNTEDAPW